MTTLHPRSRGYYSELRKRAAKRAEITRHPAEIDNALIPVAVVRRMRYEGGEYEVVLVPKLKIISTNHDTEESAQIWADEFNSKRTRK